MSIADSAATARHEGFRADDGVALCQTELDASYEEFFRDAHPRVMRFLGHLCSDRTLVEDAAQEAFITALDKWPLVSQHQHPLLWVRKTAKHKLMHLQKRQSKRMAAPLDEVRPGFLTEPLDPREAQLVLTHLLRQLPPRQAEVLALAADGSTDEEIRQELALTINTVRAYKAAARKKLAELARQNGYDAAVRRQA
jgi:RNA polymerase sigma-70 factor (ECF subfamily)